MDTTNSPAFSVQPFELFDRFNSDDALIVIDVRKHEAFLGADSFLKGAIRRDPLLINSWAAGIPKTIPVLVYCVHGREVSQSTMRFLRDLGVEAYYLEGGIEACRIANLPMQSKAIGQKSKWVTRSRPKIDRIACPWLVLRFIDSTSEFLYVPVDQVKSTAQSESATPFDVTEHVCQTVFTHNADQCSFDAFLLHYRFTHDAALNRLAAIVRAADTDCLAIAPQAAGLLAISLGMSSMHSNDNEMLKTMLPVYDALYAWCVSKEKGTNESHTWNPLLNK
ncbi:MAG TPA: chromate resistance protein [Burkholderiaceae bacterium]|nr:chromate resistance protein [Burkholderiaceae bacterium]